MQLHERTKLWRLSAKPKATNWDEGLSSRCSGRKRETQSRQPISTPVQQYSLTPTASRKSTKTIKPTRLTRTEERPESSRKKKQSKRAVFDWRNPTVCIRNGLICCETIRTNSAKKNRKSSEEHFVLGGAGEKGSRIQLSVYDSTWQGVG